MTPSWRAGIASLALLLSSSAAADPELHFGRYRVKPGHYLGQVVGRVVLGGTAVPQAQPVAHNHDQNVCGNSSPDDSLLLDATRGVANALVVVEAPSGNAPVPRAEATIDQVGCVYRPRIQAVPVGSTLTAINSDPLLHTIHGWAGAASAFNKAEPLKGDRQSVELKKPGLLAIKCDLHNWMKAYLAVIAHPYFALTGADGSFHIDGLPAGEYPVQVWHERLGVLEAKVKVPEQGPARLNFTYPTLR